MEIVVFLGKADAVRAGCDRSGFISLAVDLDTLSKRQRDILAELVSSGHSWASVPTKGFADCNQSHAPVVSRDGVAGLVEVIDSVLLKKQRSAYDKEQQRRDDKALSVERAAEAEFVARQFLGTRDEASGRELFFFPVESYNDQEIMKCPSCENGFRVSKIVRTRTGNYLKETTWQEVKELAKCLKTEKLVCGIDAHLAECKAKKARQKAQAAELERWFLRAANEEQRARFEDGFVSQREMRKVVSKALFQRYRGIEGESEDFSKYGDSSEIVDAVFITAEDIEHEESCFEVPSDEVDCVTRDAKELTSEQYRFLRLVRAAYPGPRDWLVEVTCVPRFVLCDCNQCGEWIIGFHVLVTMRSPAGQEFSKRFGPARGQLFHNSAVWNEHR